MDYVYQLASKVQMDTETKQSVTDYKDKLKQQGEELVLNSFPKKVLEFERLLKTEKFKTRDLSLVHCDLNIPIPEVPFIKNEIEESLPKKRKFNVIGNDLQGTKVLLLPNGTVPTNSLLVEIVDIVKPHIQQLVEDANVLKMWIQFLIPRIEDGNNFGVSIQKLLRWLDAFFLYNLLPFKKEDTLAEIRNVESEAAAYFDQISRYFLTRGKIIAKVAKYPHVDDFRRTVQELDEKEYLSMRLIICELRNHYATLHDIITKNLEKIKKPRNSNATETMY